MSVDSFIDTNVFIYLFDETSLGKSRIAEELQHEQQIEGLIIVNPFQTLPSIT